MKRLFFLCVLLLFAFLIYNRERVYVRDPLGSVMRDGAKVAGAQVFLNFSKDVLLENDGPPMSVILVQHDRPIGTPLHLNCLHGMACMTDAASASLAQVEDKARVESMTEKAVRFRDGEGRVVDVQLR